MEPVGTRSHDKDAPRASHDVYFHMVPVSAPTALVPPQPSLAPVAPPVLLTADVAAADTSASTPGHGKSNVAVRALLPMLPVRLVALTGVALSLFLHGWQRGRVIDDQPRLEVIAPRSLFAGAVGVIAVVLWTFMVVENARRIMEPARTQESPRPGYAVRTWILPVAFIVASLGAVSYLSSELNSPIKGTESSIPVILGIVSILALLPLLYSPITYLSSVVRRIGGHGVTLAEWLWVPAVLAAIGGSLVFWFRAGGVFGEGSDALASTWVVAVVAIVPAVVVVLLGWRAAAAVETDVAQAFTRRYSLAHKTTTRRFGAMFTDGGPNQAVLRDRGRIRQIPGVRVVGFVVSAGLAGLSLLSMVGALVTFLFWQEMRGGALGSTENERVWDILALLQDVERSVAVVVLVVASLWTFAAVSNIRMASGRRRNPILAFWMWPATAAAVWAVADRLIVEGDAVRVVAGFAAQAILLSLPFALLQRSAQAVNVRRNPILLTFVVWMLLLVHVQGLAGLSTLSETSESVQVARLAGYLAIGALLQLVATFSAAESTRSMSNAAENLAGHHNAQLDKHRSVEVSRVAAGRAVGPSVGASPPQ